MAELRTAIAEDRRAGLQPFCLVGSAGTVATGVVDPLDELAAVAAEEGLWLHLDDAYGTLAAGDPETRPLFAGLERADSLALDPHKWLYVPVDCGPYSSAIPRRARTPSARPPASTFACWPSRRRSRSRSGTTVSS